MIKTTLPGKLGAIETVGAFTSVYSKSMFKVLIEDETGKQIFVGGTNHGMVYLPEMQPTWKLIVENIGSETHDFFLNVKR